MDDVRYSRRRLLAATGSTVLAATLAGCSGGDDETDATESASPESSPADEDYTDDERRVAEFLRASPTESTFDGTFVDETDADEVRVAVGAQGNQGAFAFAPVAVRVSVGTTVSWEWTGEGGEHNVSSVGSGDLGGEFESDVEFRSGDPKRTGDPYTRTFEESGAALYFCEPHESLGMKGGVVVE